MQSRYSTRLVAKVKARLCSLLVITGLLGTIIFSLSSLLKWGLVHDVAILSYTGWLVLEGKLPYSEVLEFNTPLCYIIYALQVLTFGTSKTGWLLSLLCWLISGIAGIRFYLRRHGEVDKLIATLIYTIFVLSSGHASAGQKDFFYGIFAIWGAAILLFTLEENSSHNGRLLLISGALFGCTFALRPHFFLCPLLIFFSRIKQIRKIHNGSIQFLIGLSLPWLTCLIWLLSIGSLYAFLEFTFQFTLPVYATVGNIKLIDLLHTALGFFSPLLLIFATGSLVGKSSATRRDIAVLGLIGGLVAYLLQRKGWLYHLSGMTPFLSILSVYAVRNMDLLSSRKNFILTLFTITTFIYMTSNFGTMRSNNLAPFDQSTTLQMIDSLHQYDLTKLRIQPFDHTGGSLQALLFLEKTPATKFIYDIYFYNSLQKSYISRLRKEFIAELSSNPPDLVLVSNFSWPQRWLGFDRINKFLEFRSFLEKHYLVCEVQPKFWIYTLKPPNYVQVCEKAAEFHQKQFKNNLVDLNGRYFLIEDNKTQGSNTTRISN